MKSISVKYGIFMVGMIFLDLYIKIWIAGTCDVDNHSCKGGFLHFHPTYNTAGNALNARFGIGYSRMGFLLLTFVGSAVAIALWIRFMRKIRALPIKKIWGFGYALFLAGMLGRAIERIFWSYTLDYIAVRKIGIFDFTDVYLIVGAILAGVAEMKLERYERRQKAVKDHE